MNYLISNHRSTLHSLPMNDVYRYMGTKHVIEELRQMAEGTLPLFLQAADCKACYVELPVTVIGELVDCDLFSVNSMHLARYLSGCSSLIMFAATIGGACDRQRHIASVTSPTKALILDAMGSAAIEAFCDELCELFARQNPNCKLHPRFSPGYGDLPIELQTDFLQILDAQRRIGLMLSESMMMLPQKSVTAIVGIEKRVLN